MAKTAFSEDQLTTAAQSLAEELHRFDDVAGTLQRTPLDSQKNLERAAQALHEVASIDERLTAHVQTLVQAINSARERQQTQAHAVEARAQELQARTSIFQELLRQYGELGTHAGQLNTLMQKVASEHKDSPTPAEAAQSSLHFEELKLRMDQVVESAESLMKSAEERDFLDLARQADSLRQQLLSARNKMGLLQKKLGLTPQAQA